MFTRAYGSFHASAQTRQSSKFSLVFFLVLSISLWVAAIALVVIDVDNIVRRRLWLACVVAPPKVWARGLLAQ